MRNKDLKQIINTLLERVKIEPSSFREEKEFFLEILQQNGEQLKNFKKEIWEKWHQFKVKNHGRVITKHYTTFFFEYFQQFYIDYLKIFYGFDPQSIELISKEKVSQSDIYFEYKYSISREDEKIYIDAINQLKDKIYGISFPFGLLFFATSIFGIIIRSLIKKNVFIILEAAVLKKEGNKNYIHFLVLARNSLDEQFKYYFQKDLYYFLRPYRGIPNEFYEKLLVGRERLYQIALKEYTLAKEKLIDLFYYFYKKCALLHNLSSLLDFLNFVCARVEDSVFSKVDIIMKDLLINLDYSVEKKNALIRIFNYIDKESTLYSTFQANNLPSAKSQLNLFLLFIKYYFSSGLEGLEVGNLLYFPDIFKLKINQTNKEKTHRIIDSNSIKNINNFVNYFLKIFEYEYEGAIIFNKIFHSQIFDINIKVLKSFLTSLNNKILAIIKEENKGLSEKAVNDKLTFEGIVSDLCRILYVLINKIFLKNTPEEASINFIDPRSRYVGRNIALRVQELFFFQALNISDDLWPDYLISLNRDNIMKELNGKIEIPESNFYSVKELTHLMLFHNLQSFIEPRCYEDLLVDDIIVPINDFLLIIKDSVEDPKNKIEVYDHLQEFFLDGIEEKRTIKRIKLACRLIAPFWKTMI